MYRQIARNKRLSAVYVLVFLSLWVGIGALVGTVWAATSTSSGLNPASSGAGRDVLAGSAVAAALALGAIAFSLTSGTRVILTVSGAQPADPTRYRQLHDLVEALALGEGMPTPAVYVVDDPSPNAFATGTSPARAVVTVTTGLLQIMDRDELEGVLAHELSHVKNYDTRLLLIVSTLIGMAGLLASLAWRSAMFTPGRSRGRNGGQTALVVLAAAALLSAVAFLLGPLVRLALSRRRESLADVSGVELTRNPAGLISALQKLEANDRPLAKLNHATAAMCIDDPLQHHEGWVHRLYDTHPPLSDRIAALQQVAQGQSV